MFHRPYFRYAPKVIEKTNNCIQNMPNMDFKYVISGISTEEIRKFNINTSSNSFIYHERKKSAEARNIIINSSLSQWVAFFDGDCMPTEDYFNKLEEIVEKRESENSKDIVAYTGSFLPMDVSRFGKYELLEDKNSFNYFLDKNDKTIKLLWGGNCLLKKSMLEEVRGFDEKIPSGIDRDLAARIIKSGYKIKFKPDLLVNCRYNQNFRQIIRRKWWHGSGLAKVYETHGDVLGSWGMKEWAIHFFDSIFKPPKEFRESLDSRFYYLVTSWTYGISILLHARKFV